MFSVFKALVAKQCPKLENQEAKFWCQTSLCESDSFYKGRSLYKEARLRERDSLYKEQSLYEDASLFERDSLYKGRSLYQGEGSKNFLKPNLQVLGIVLQPV